MSLCATGGYPLPALLLAPFFFRAGLSIVPRSLLLNLTKTLATQAMADRESSVALCHGVALKKKKGKKKNDRSWTEREVEKNATRREFGRELSLEVFAVSINKTRTVLGTEAHSSVLHTIGQRKVTVELCFKAGHI